MNKKTIILADTHAGVRSDSDIFLDNFKNLYTKFLPEIIEKYQLQENYIFTLGDIFDNRNHINNKTLNVVIEERDKFKEKYPNIKQEDLIGNHDIYYRNTKDIHSLKIFSDNIIDTITEKTIFGRKVVFCPWITDKEESNKLFNIKADICFGHFEISGFEMVPGYYEKNGISRHLFKDNFKLTFSGHFHIRNESESIVYIGSPYQMSWNDMGLEKGIYLLDFETLEYTFILNPYYPKFKKIYLSQIIKNEIDIKKEIPNNFIKLVINSEIVNDNLNKLNYLISSLNPLSFEVEDIEKKFGDINVDLSEGTSPLAFLFDYIDSKNLTIDKDNLKRKIIELYNKVEVK